MTTLENMSQSDLRRLIEEIVDERLAAREAVRRVGQDMSDKPSWDEARAFIETHRLKPTPGSKSPLEMLREDRDR